MSILIMRTNCYYEFKIVREKKMLNLVDSLKFTVLTVYSCFRNYEEFKMGDKLNGPNWKLVFTYFLTS
jgi:hypothetical protein